MHSKICLPETLKLNYVIIKHAIYSTLKSKSSMLYCCHLGLLHSLPFHKLSPYKHNKGSYLMVEPGILFPLPV